MKPYLITILNLLVALTQAQNFQWAKNEGLYKYDYGYGAVNDNSGNLYVAGKYEDFAVFSSYTVGCSGNHDIFVAKYDPSGALAWINTAGGTGGDYAHAEACDGSNVYIAGEIEGFNNPVAFNGSSVTLICIGDNDAFLAKYDLDGNLLWAKSEGWLRSDKALGITADNSGNVYICGYFTDTTKFNGSMIYGSGGQDIYIAKYDSKGDMQWFRNAGGSGRDEAKAIKCDAAGNIYICGLFSNGANFSGTTLTCSANYYDAFVAKYSPDGTLAWVKKAGGDYDDVAWCLTIDNQDRLYVTGEFNAYAMFGSIGFPTTGMANIFIASYDNAGNVLWAKGAGGNLIDRARGIGTDGSTLFITGQFGSTANFDSHSITAVDSSDVFVAAFSNDGNFIWAAAVGGTVDAYEDLGYESGNSVCAYSGNVYATGSLLGGGAFGSYNVSGYARTDAFIAKISSEPAGFNEMSLNENIQIYPNPGNGLFTLDLSHCALQSVQITVYNSLGLKVDDKISKPSYYVDIDLANKADGIYLAEIRSKDRTLIKKKIILQH